MAYSLRSRNGGAAAQKRSDTAPNDNDADTQNSFEFDNMPSSISRPDVGRKQSAEALSMAFMKALGGVCCQGCGKDPVDEHALRQDINASSSSPSAQTNLATMQRPTHPGTSISPLVMQPMSGTNGGGSTTIALSQIEGLIGEYMCLCRFYQVPFNGGIVTTLRYSLPSLRISGPFHDMDMLALSELLLRHANGLLAFIQRLDFSMAIHGKQTAQRAGFTSHGALALAKALQNSKFIRQVWLPRHRIGPYGASAIFLACRDNATIQQLNMRRCRIGERGALALCELILNRTSHLDGPGLIDVDLSTNGIGHTGTVAIERAMKVWNEKTPAVPLFVNLEGNLVFPEVRTNFPSVCILYIATCPSHQCCISLDNECSDTWPGHHSLRDGWVSPFRSRERQVAHTPNILLCIHDELAFLVHCFHSVSFFFPASTCKVHLSGH